MNRILYVLFALFTAVVGHRIHGSAFWAVMDFIFSALAWLKWFICGEVNLTIIKGAFAGFLQ